MKTFFLGLLIVVAAVIAIKLVPLTLVMGFVLGLALLAVLALGFSAVALLCFVLLALAAVLAPIWIPVLVVMGLIALIKRCSHSSANPVTAG